MLFIHNTVSLQTKVNENDYVKVKLSMRLIIILIALGFVNKTFCIKIYNSELVEVN